MLYRHIFIPVYMNILAYIICYNKLCTLRLKPHLLINSCFSNYCTISYIIGVEDYVQSGSNEKPISCKFIQVCVQEIQIVN